jgi:hypothetical protein
VSHEPRPLPPHDPTERVLVAREGVWDVRQFPENDPKFAYFAKRGFLHLQLWDAAGATSILTPSKLTGGNFEVWISGRGYTAAAEWATILRVLARADAPGESWLRALDRWYIAPHETPQVRLARIWWRGQRATKEWA